MNKKILVLEESEPLRQSLIYILTEEGFFPIPAASLEEALQVVQKESVSLVIADVNSSIASGMIQVKTLSEGSTEPSFPVIIFHNDLAGAHEITDNDSVNMRFIAKPFSRDVLIAAVGSFL